MYGVIGMSASSLHRESTDSLIHAAILKSMQCLKEEGGRRGRGGRREEWE